MATKIREYLAVTFFTTKKHEWSRSLADEWLITNGHEDARSLAAAFLPRRSTNGHEDHADEWPATNGHEDARGHADETA